MNSTADAKEIFFAALDQQSPQALASYLDKACGSNTELRERVEQLLRAHEQAGQFLGGPAPAEATIDQQISETPGSQIGPYKLLQQIGEGGMGVVYMAEQHEPVKRRVALKIIKPGMDSRQVIARFEAERQALSLMDHPNIAKVLDAGTTASGRPYFVMELVKGQPITQYCDEKHLTPRQRLELLLPVCQAIQHAHQKGIIHRDIKPTNILVAEYDQQPVPKVIDFGVAKATSQTLTEKTMFTGLGQIVGTLEYMSPEQAKVNQLDIDTRSDIYSLGVLLYELLTGSTPFDRKRLRSAAFDEMLRIIREEEPPKPSTRLSDSQEALPSISAQRHTEPAKLTKLVRGELDWIVMKALEKDRARRYETASAFAADLQHYLSDEPVVACPPSATYRFRKFARRNKARLVAATVLAVALLIAVSGIGWAVRDRVAREAEIVQERTNREAKVAGQVETILNEVDGLEHDQKWPEALMAARRADVALSGGEADSETAERVRQRLKDLEFIDRLERIRMESATWVKKATYDYARRDREYAQAFRDYGVDIDELAVETSIDRLKNRSALAIPVAAALDEWVVARRLGQTVDVVAWKRLVAVARSIDPEPLRDRIRVTRGQPVSEVQDELRRLAESIDVRAQHPTTLARLASLDGIQDSQAAVRLLRDAQEAYPGDFWLNFGLAHALEKQYDRTGAIRYYTAAVSIRPSSVAAHNNLGNVLRYQNKLDEAIRHYRKAIELDPNIAMFYSNLGLALQGQKKLDDAMAYFKKAIEIDPNYAVAHNNLGVLLCEDLKDYDKGIVCCRRAIELDPKDVNTCLFLGNVLRARGKPDEAVTVYRQAIEANPEAASYYWGKIGDTLRVQKKLDEAISAYRKAIDADPKSSVAYLDVGRTLRDQKKKDDAIAAFRKAIELGPTTGVATQDLYEVLRDEGKPDEAFAVLHKAIELNPKAAYFQDILGVALLNDLKDNDKAAECFRKAIELNPKYARPWVNLSYVLVNQGKQEDAIAACRKAIEIDPHPMPAARAYFRMGKILEDQGKLDETIASFRKAAELDPDYAIAHSCLVWLLTNCREAKFRDVSGGLDAARKAVEAAPQSSLAWEVLGWARYRGGDWKASIEALEKSCALQDDPDPKGGDALQWFFLAMAHWQLGEKDKAREWYDRAAKWMEANAKDSADLIRFRAEAEELMKKE